MNLECRSINYSFMNKKVLVFFSFFVLLAIFLSLGKSSEIFASVPFDDAYTTLSNSRFSFKASISSAGVGNSANYATIQTGLAANDTTDSDTGNLFPGDIICFNGMASNGCKNSQPVGGTYTIQGINNTTSFAFDPILAGTLVGGDRVISTQSGQITVTFKPTTNVSALNKLILTIPAATSNPDDGIPDSTGFDSADLPADLVGGTGCTGSACLTSVGIGISAATLATAGSSHTITITLSSDLQNNTTYTMTLGHATNAIYRFLNPAPALNTHTRGVADTYSIRIYTQNTAGTITYDDTTMKVVPIDGVLVSANIELSLTYTIASVGTATTVPACNTGSIFTTSVATTATAVPFGSIINLDTFYNAAQTHTISTNASNGYTLTAQYDMPLNLGIGATVPGITIPDGNCDGSCTADTAATWNTADNNGFAYTLGNITGADAAFTASSGFKIFSSSPKTIMSKASQTSSSVIDTCYRLSVDATQQTGYYKNKLTYIATPKF